MSTIRLFHQHTSIKGQNKQNEGKMEKKNERMASFTTRLCGRSTVTYLPGKWKSLERWLLNRSDINVIIIIIIKKSYTEYNIIYRKVKNI